MNRISRQKKELRDFYRFVKEVIESKTLSKRKACDLATMFMVVAADSDYK